MAIYNVELLGLDETVIEVKYMRTGYPDKLAELKHGGNLDATSLQQLVFANRPVDYWAAIDAKNALDLVALRQQWVGKTIQQDEANPP